MPKKITHPNLKKINGLQKAWISHVTPQIDDGEFPAKGIINQWVAVHADIFCDGIDELSACLRFKKSTAEHWQETPMLFVENDRWTASFQALELGVYYYTIDAWVNDYFTWKKRFLKKIDFQDDVLIEQQMGVELFVKAHSPADDDCYIKSIIQQFKNIKEPSQFKELLLNERLDQYMLHQLKPDYITHFEKTLSIVIDPLKAQFSTWYEVFPRSLASEAHQHGTLNDLRQRLPAIKNMGFDVIYLPPIHPIGFKNRKGKNNNPSACSDDVGSPWAIGSTEGGHKSIHPQLGTIEDFKQLVSDARALDIDIALDFAIQCSPDHPYLQNHEEWFKHRPDGSLQYAENPPKKYQDIYPIYFSTPEWKSLWLELRSIISFWIEQGVRIFRVDNPHTKSFIFWKWLIEQIKSEHPEIIFLAEAFTRPRIMEHLAKCGFSQSYTYFTWRNTKHELTTYMNELNSNPVCHYFRPNFWPNTPDILPDFLQQGGVIAFKLRLVLAATLCSNYGIYGPAYEQCIRTSMHQGSEEYVNSEKYEIIDWNKGHETIQEFISLINAIRHQHPALQINQSLQFYHTDNDHIICYSKHTSDKKNLILVVVNLDFQYQQSAFIDINFKNAGMSSSTYYLHDVLSDQKYSWNQGRCYVELNPLKNQCAHIFYVRDNVND